MISSPNIFIPNKYTRLYNSLIEKAKERNWSKETAPVYVESHHIIPWSISEDNSPENKVLLTAREHFVCHLLLIKMTEGKNKRKMLFSFKLMNEAKNKHQKYRYTSRIYEYYRSSIANEISLINKGRPAWNKGKRFPKEVRLKMSKMASTPQRKNIAISNFKKASLSNIGRKHLKETKLKISIGNKGKVFSKETRQKMSRSAKESGHGTNNVKSAYRQVSCILCKKTMSYSNYMRWHNH